MISSEKAPKRRKDMQRKPAKSTDYIPYARMTAPRPIQVRKYFVCT